MSSYPPQQPYQPQGPAPQPYAAQPFAKADGMAVTSLVLGLIGIVFTWLFFLVFPLICAILAVIFGHVSISKIGKSGGRLTGKGMAIGGLVCGYLEIAIWLFWTFVIAGASANGSR